jgi:hypothetical protein
MFKSFTGTQVLRFAQDDKCHSFTTTQILRFAQDDAARPPRVIATAHPVRASTDFVFRRRG